MDCSSHDRFASGYLVGIGMFAGDQVHLIKCLDRFSRDFNVSTISLKESYDFIAAWNSFVDKRKTENETNTPQTVFEPAKIRIIGAVSIPFMEFICDQFHATQHNVLAELETVQGDFDLKNKISEIKRIFIDAPFAGDEYEWEFLKAKQGALSFYSRKVDKDGINLYYENGFILKINADATIKIPVSGGFTKLDDGSALKP
ncbi:hypothetical protein SDC9_133832 [bioreactor metagenome]|uniref:Uncharacterized protein n=1 Tax=bioreactor metagenome TaxID=1076179 RepID=A0A645DBP7_9ZZZZ